MIYLALLFILISWIMPNHYYPWPSAWNDFFAISGLFLIIIGNKSNDKYFYISKYLLYAIMLMIFSVSSQFLTGRLKYFGDYFMVLLYLAIFFLSISVGSILVRNNDHGSSYFVLLQETIILGSIFSVGIALVQWTNAVDLGIYGVDLPASSRPFGNLAQPNNLCTLIFLGICSLYWLRQKEIIKDFSFIIAQSFLLFGMVLTQSRTGVVQISLLAILGLTYVRKDGFRLSRYHFVFLWIFFILCTLLFSDINNFLLLGGEREISDYINPGSRIPYWFSMLDAIGREFNFGYGWMQTSEAQQRVALDHSSLGEIFEHAHNIMLDIILWNGFWIGGGVLVFVFLWVFSHKKSLHHEEVFFILMGVLGIFIHAMLEFPLEYAYLLIPFGMFLGAADYLIKHGGLDLFKIGRSCITVLIIVIVPMFSILSFEYFRLENYYKIMRLESANIGTYGLETKPPEIYLLTHLEDYLKFVHVEAKENMSVVELMRVKNVSERFPFPPVLFRSALAYGLNEDMENSKIKLELICGIYSIERCSEAHEGWDILRKRFPQLNGVDF